MSKLGNVRVRKNAGAIVGSRRLLNFNEGANVTLTITDDNVGDEIDITIASAGGAGTAWLDQFFSASDPDSYKGTYATMLMADDIDTLIRQTFVIPTDIVTIIEAALVIIPDDSGNVRWGVSTNAAQLCANEDYQANTDSIAAGQTAVDIDQVECLDISAGLTGMVGDDIVGIEFTRYASDALDTVDADVHFLGIIIAGST